jgi:hypothetical protein
MAGWLASQARGVLSDTSHQHQPAIEGFKEFFAANIDSVNRSGPMSFAPPAEHIEALAARILQARNVGKSTSNVEDFCITQAVASGKPRRAYASS